MPYQHVKIRGSQRTGVVIATRSVAVSRVRRSSIAQSLGGFSRPDPRPRRKQEDRPDRSEGRSDRGWIRRRAIASQRGCSEARHPASPDYPGFCARAPNSERQNAGGAFVEPSPVVRCQPALWPGDGGDAAMAGVDGATASAPGVFVEWISCHRASPWRNGSLSRGAPSIPPEQALFP